MALLCRVAFCGVGGPCVAHLNPADLRMAGQDALACGGLCMAACARSRALGSPSSPALRRQVELRVLTRRRAELEAALAAAESTAAGATSAGGESAAAAAASGECATLSKQLVQTLEALTALSADSAEQRACQILDGLGIDAAMRALPVKRLSGGWRVRVCLAAALFVRCDLLLLDEPTVRAHAVARARTGACVDAAQQCSARAMPREARAVGGAWLSVFRQLLCLQPCPRALARRQPCCSCPRCSLHSREGAHRTPASSLAARASSRCRLPHVSACHAL